MAHCVSPSESNWRGKIRQLEAVFFERDPPHEILTDNDTAFRSEEFQAFAHEWGILLQFRCVYAPAGNGIAERCHRTVKRITARMRCPIQEAVYWYNITPRDDVSPATAPANKIYRYEVGVKAASHAIASPRSQGQLLLSRRTRVGQSAAESMKFSKGEVTKIINPQSILVDEIPRYVKDLRPRHYVITPEVDSDSTTSSERRAESLLQDDVRRFWVRKCTHWINRSRTLLPAFTKKY